MQRCKGAKVQRCKIDSLKKIRWQTSRQTDRQTNRVTSSLLELLVAAKNRIWNNSILHECFKNKCMLIKNRIVKQSIHILYQQESDFGPISFTDILITNKENLRNMFWALMSWIQFNCFLTETSLFYVVHGAIFLIIPSWVTDFWLKYLRQRALSRH